MLLLFPLLAQGKVKTPTYLKLACDILIQTLVVDIGIKLFKNLLWVEYTLSSTVEGMKGFHNPLSIIAVGWYLSFLKPVML